jgi:heme-degrading monooxygenase HmoA
MKPARCANDRAAAGSKQENRKREPLMVIILFRSKLTTAAGQDYQDMGAEMEKRVRTMPGLVDFKYYSAEDGERLTVVWWKDRESLEHWRQDERHRVAKKTGREQWYEYYKMELAEVFRESHFQRATEVVDATQSA